jgi:salicylate hydroxylase
VATPSRTVVIAGAGIAGLTTALSLAQRGLRAVLLDQTERLDEAGAGLQLSPNASRVLIDLGLGDRLRAAVVVPQALRILRAHDGREVSRIPLAQASSRFGAPYWVIHRGDLQGALLDAARAQPDVRVVLGVRFDRFALHANGVTVKGVRARPDPNSPAGFDANGIALIGADGIWSSVRSQLGDQEPARFAGRVAYRAVVPADMVAASAREPMINLWLGPRCHLVHYPVAGGRLINLVAIAEDAWNEQGWSTGSPPAEVLARYPLGRWSRAARDLIGMPERWLKWALYDRQPSDNWGEGPVTLVGDAAHPMLPFLAQGAAMAIEDAALVAEQIASNPADPAAGLRAYEAERRGRTTRMQRDARRTGTFYHYSGPDAFARNLVLRALGGEWLLRRYDWIYGWRGTEQAKG